MASASFRRFGSWYNNLLLTHPVKTKTLTAVAIASAGDVACQVLEQRARNERDEEHLQRQGINLARTARMAIFTSAVTPPVHFWYAFLTRRFPTSPLLRMVADQTVWAPTGLVLCFLSLGAMETGRLQTGMDRTRENFFPVLVRNWMIWPAVQFMNFKYLPPQFQVLFVNFVSFFWSMYVSNMANAQASAPDRQEAGTATTKPVLLDGEVVVDGRVAANTPARGDIPAAAAPTSSAASVAR